MKILNKTQKQRKRGPNPLWLANTVEDWLHSHPDFIKNSDSIDTIVNNYCLKHFQMPASKFRLANDVKDGVEQYFYNLDINDGFYDKENLNEEIHTPQLDEIEQYLEEIYQLRKDSLEQDGQYGIGNLVFKEIRNKGYLDNLKDLKNELKSKELSLEEDTVKNSKGKWVNKGEDGTHGEFKTKKAADTQRKAMFANGYHEELDERLEERQRIDYRNELSRIAYAQPVIQDSGLFHIYNIKEDDVDRIVRRIRDLNYIEWVNKSESGKYDFSKAVMFGQLPARYYTITGKIKEEI